MHDFLSDARTKPTRAMLQSIFEADVGDEQLGGDPTTDRLCDRVAGLLGHEAAVLLPSGTMCNEIAINVHCNPGDEVICDRSSYIVTSEVGGPAALSGVMMQVLDGERGIFTADQLEALIRPRSRFSPEARLVCLENTSNLGGGAIWPLDQIAEVIDVARKHGLATHMDGARLMNAAVASGVSAKQFAQQFDSCWIDFAKGLGAPIGAVLAGSKAFIDNAWRVKQQWGGAMHQSGIVSAMCLYALDNNIVRLAEDHSNARIIGQGLSQLRLVDRVMPVETNIVIVDISAQGPDAAALVSALCNEGFETGIVSNRRIRIVTHIGVDRTACDTLVSSLENYLN